jgi:membrane protease YdiL (CAAX protease family)
MNDSLNYLTNSTHTGKTGFENLSPAKVTLCLLLLLLAAYFIPFVIQKSNLLENQYGAEMVAKSKDYSDPEEFKVLRVRMNLWTSGLTLPFLALLFPLIISNYTGLNKSDLGWKNTGLIPSIKQGFTWLIILVPIVYILQFFMVKIQLLLPGEHVTDHPLTQLADQKLLALEWIMLFCSAVIGAPLLEEQIFRGLIQPWIMAKKSGVLITISCAIFLSVLQFKSDWFKAFSLAWGDRSIENDSQLQIHITKALGPLLFSLLISIIIIIINKKNRLNAAIGATALLFGMIHAFAWPSPVGLTLLGIGLGMAYAKTGNIITPIFIHMGFNCLAFGLLLLQNTKA